MIVETVSKEELAEWLLGKGLGAENHGYGHASCDTIAEALLEEFVVGKEWEPTDG